MIPHLIISGLMCKEKLPTVYNAIMLANVLSRTITGCRKQFYLIKHGTVASYSRARKDSQS